MADLTLRELSDQLRDYMDGDDAATLAQSVDLELWTSQGGYTHTDDGPSKPCHVFTVHLRNEDGEVTSFDVTVSER